MITSGIVLALWFAIGMVAYALGVHEVSSTIGRYEAVAQLIFFQVVLCVPLFCAGVATMKGSIKGIWAGLCLLVGLNLLALSCLFGWIQLEVVTIGGIDARVKSHSLLLAMTIVGTITYVACVYAFYSDANRRLRNQKM